MNPPDIILLWIPAFAGMTGTCEFHWVVERLLHFVRKDKKNDGIE